MTHIRHLTTDLSPGSGKGITTRLIEQLEALQGEAKAIADIANNSLTTIAEINKSMERIINGIEGPGGDNYADHDGDGTIEEAGDGVGAISHANDAITHAGLAGSAVQLHGDLAKVNAQSSIDFMTMATDKAIADVLGGSETIARLSVGQVAGLIDNALNGRDADVDGVIAGPDEAGAVQAYREAQLMATYSLTGGEIVTAPTEEENGGTVVQPPVTGDSSVPLLAQIGVTTSLVFLVVGGLLVLSARRSRQRV